MKVWAIKVGEGAYLEYSKKGFNMSWRGSTPQATEDKRKAKHYKTEVIAGAVLKGRATERRNHADRYEKRIAQATQSGENVEWIKKTVASYRESADRIDTFEVVAVLVDTPNFSKQAVQDVKFAKYGIGFTTKKSQGNLYCKGCGIYFKAIPIMQFGTRDKPSRICPWCIQERAHEAQKLLDGMNKDQKENAEAERFIHKMG